MFSVVKILKQLNNQQLKTLTREFGIKVKSDSRSDLIMGLIRPRQIGGYALGRNNLPSIGVEDDEDVWGEDEGNEDDWGENEGPNDWGEDERPDERNEGPDEFLDPMVRLLNELENNFDIRNTALETISGRARRGEIEISDEDLSVLRVMVPTVVRYLFDLKEIEEFNQDEVNLDDIDLITNAQEYLIESRETYEGLKARYA